MPTVEELGLEWSAGLGGASGTPLNGIFVSHLDSTQRLARTLLDQCVHEDEGPLPFVVVALAQSAGRGRQDRGWWSPAGSGLYASLVLPVADAGHLQMLPVRVAAALADFLGERSGGDCRIKWPNDLLIGRRKIGGILVDAVTPPGPAGSWAIVGVGLNYVTPEPDRIPDATSVMTEAEQSGVGAPSLGGFVVGAISSLWRSVTEIDNAGWVERYQRLSAHRPGDSMRFRLGEEEIAGTFDGFDEHGFLKLDTASGARLIRSGEVFAW